MSSLLEQVKEAVLECKDIMLSPFSVEQKDSVSNIVTSADKEVEERLKKSLLRLLPNAAFIGEEGGVVEGDAFQIVVDPIDGTANFARGLNASAISVGIMKNGEGEIGVVYNPFNDELYWAEKGKGAFLNGEPIQVSDRDFKHGLYYTALSLYRKDYAENCINILRNVYSECDDFRREGSAALELCRLASGKGELYFEIRIFPWDCCAAEIILKEAGGVSQHLYSENRTAAQPFPIIAANNEKNLKKLYKIVKKELPKLPKTYDSEKFKYIELPETHIPPYLNDDVDLQEMHAQCTQELTLQQSKRDQLIAFYLTITGLVSTYLFSEKVNLGICAVIFFILFLVGFIWSTVIIRYKVYKDAYWVCCKTISSLYCVEREIIDKAYVQHTFYKAIEKSYKDIPRKKHDETRPSLIKNIKKNFTSAEFLMFLTLALLSALSGGAFLFFLSNILNWGWIGHLMSVLLVVVFIAWQISSYNKAALSVYKVVIDKLDSSFSKTFKKAWFLHFFI